MGYLDEGLTLPQKVEAWQAQRGVFHKEKSTKKETTKGHKSNVNSTYVQMEGSTADGITQEANGIRQTTSVAPSGRRNAEIDRYLYGLIMEGMIQIEFMSWHAKCVYTIGMVQYNMFVVIARRGREPNKLLSSKLKAAMDYHKDLANGIE